MDTVSLPVQAAGPVEGAGDAQPRAEKGLQDLAARQVLEDRPWIGAEIEDALDDGRAELESLRAGIVGELANVGAASSAFGDLDFDVFGEAGFKNFAEGDDRFVARSRLRAQQGRDQKQGEDERPNPSGLKPRDHFASR